MMLLVAGVIIKNPQEQILLLQEKSSGLWGPPAGHQEEGESLDQTAVREVKEETGLDIQPTGILQIGTLKIPDGREYVVVLYSAELKTSKITLQQDEVSDYVWASRQDLLSDKYKFRISFLKDTLVRSFTVTPVPLDTFVTVTE